MTPVYLYQTIHTLGYRPRLLDAHVALLGHWSQVLFGQNYTPDVKKLTAQIAAMLEAQRCPRDLSVFVRLTLDPTGKEELATAGVSLYSGYALRSLAPEAAVITYELPHPDAPTSVREAATALAQVEATCAGAQISIRCDNEGMLRTADNAPLFAIRGKRLFAPPAALCVESQLVLEAANRATLKVTPEAVMRNQLGTYDELFYCDHRGVTALSRYEGHPYMDILAGRIAREVEGIFV